ncbi:unnamed protein product [Prorocentrum cordatum]|uniref:Uncharacterized protein n=1 Tax=Prorocentrum cordatum TaxID=2364126 RepID=A0ABN9Y649_9DINO|nr:unnamed protein product [Polarella glacialis]
MLQVDMRVSADVHVDRGALAGCSFATSPLHFVLLGGGAASKGKRVSCVALAAAISMCVQLELRARGSKGMWATNRLGVDVASLRRRATKVQRRRWQSLLSRLYRFSGFESSFSGMHRVLETGGAQSAFHGMRVTGMSPDQLAPLSAVVGSAAFGPARGRSGTFKSLFNQDRKPGPANQRTGPAWHAAPGHRSMLATCCTHYRGIAGGIPLGLSTFGRHPVAPLVEQGTCRQLLRYVSVASPDGRVKQPLIAVIREGL